MGFLPLLTLLYPRLHFCSGNRFLAYGVCECLQKLIEAMLLAYCLQSVDIHTAGEKGEFDAAFGKKDTSQSINAKGYRTLCD